MWEGCGEGKIECGWRRGGDVMYVPGSGATGSKGSVTITLVKKPPSYDDDDDDDDDDVDEDDDDDDDDDDGR